jgi:integrase
VQDALSESWNIPLPRDVVLQDCLDEYQKHACTRNTPRTVELNLSILESLKDHLAARLGPRRPILLSHVSPEALEDYIRTKKDAGLSPWTLNRQRGSFSTFFNFARKRGLIRVNPVEKVAKLPVVKNRIPTVLDPKEIKALLQQAEEPVPFHGRGKKGKGNSRARLTPIHDMILFALNTGARLGEMLYLEWADLDMAKRVVTFRCKPEHSTKDRQDRQLGANAPLLRMLQRRKLQAGKVRWVFPNIAGGVIDRGNALRELKVVARLAAVPWATFQIMRRTFITKCAAGGMPSFVLKSLAGHSSVKTTEQYYVGSIGGKKWIPPVVGA